MDDADMAQERIEATEAMAIAAARNAKPEAEYTGYCLFCGDETRFGQRWCDVSCRNSWQARKARL